ncbi:MAG: formyltransferase family protein [Patescibacteria group bacterium]
MQRKKLLVYASGEADPNQGGSGVLKLWNATQDGSLNADIVAVVSNHAQGGVYTKMHKLTRFIHSPKGRTVDDYRRIMDETQPDFTALSGWLGYMITDGYDPHTTFNIHPAINLRRFGGHHFHGMNVHRAAIEAFRNGEVKHSGVSMHFVTDVYDDPDAVIFNRIVPILDGDEAEDLRDRVNKVEHEWQATITNRIVTGEIVWPRDKPLSDITGRDIQSWPDYRGDAQEN